MIPLALRAPPDRLRLSPTATSAALAGLTVAMAALAAWLTLSTPGGSLDHPARAAIHVADIAVPLAAGFYAMRKPHTRRFGRMLIVAALVWSLATLGESHDSLQYSVGRVTAWLIPAILVYAMLSFPGAGVAAGFDRLLVLTAVAITAILYIGTAPLIEAYPTNTPWASCRADCPANAFQIVGHQPSFVAGVVYPLRETLSVALLLGVTVSLIRRIRHAGPLRRATVAPVLGMSAVTVVLLGAFLGGREAGLPGPTLDTLGLLWAAAVPAVAAAFLIGLVRRRIFLGRVLSRLSLSLGAGARTTALTDLGAALRSAVGDPSAEILARDGPGGRWVREDGTTADPELLAAPARKVLVLHDGEASVAAMSVDAGVDAEDELLDAVVAQVEVALDQARLTRRLESSLRELDRSRERIATAADAERRRIERDIHDGAQQQLIALRMKLALVEDLVADDPPAAASAIHALGDDVDGALAEVRALAHGIYPPLLADRGLVDALRATAKRSPLPAEVSAEGVTRHASALESAVYFASLEALQNAGKHAEGATGVRISLHQDDAFTFEVADDGAGMPARDADAPETGGLRNMRERVEAIGGTLTITSRPGGGTRVRGWVPLHDEGPDDAPAPRAPAPRQTPAPARERTARDARRSTGSA